jgi:hypothetical protein
MNFAMLIKIKILSYALSIRTIPPLLNLEKIVGSSRTLPTTLTGLAGLISFLDLLAGVGPQKIHIAFPGGFPRGNYL